MTDTTTETYVMPKLEVGDKAPLFKAKNQNGDLIDIQQILESGQQVLLIFYPGDDTPGCTKQLCGIRDVYSEYKKLGVQVFGVNHADEKSHEKFISKYTFQFDILVDTNKEIAKLYGAMKKFFANYVIKRGAFLIGTDGVIQYRYWGQQDNEEIIELIKKTR